MMSRSVLRTAVRRVLESRAEALRFASRAWPCAFVVQGSLAALGLRRTLRWIEAVPARRGGPRFDAVTVVEGAQLVDRVYRVHAVRGACLPRSLLQYLLHRRDGVRARLILGVRRRRGDAAGGLEAHAWVEAPAASAQTSPRDAFASLLVSGA
jgi:hypothetical protein